MIAEVDRWLIERVFEPAAHFMERGFGLTGFNLARFAVILLPVSDATKFWWEPDLWNICALLFTLTAAFGRFVWLAHLEGLTGANPEKHLPYMPRIRIYYAVLVLIIISLWALVGHNLLLAIGCSGFWVHLYFSACDKPPPLEETSRFWRQSQA